MKRLSETLEQRIASLQEHLLLQAEALANEPIFFRCTAIRLKALLAERKFIVIVTSDTHSYLSMHTICHGLTDSLVIREAQLYFSSNLQDFVHAIKNSVPSNDVCIYDHELQGDLTSRPIFVNKIYSKIYTLRDPLNVFGGEKVKKILVIEHPDHPFYALYFPSNIPANMLYLRVKTAMLYLWLNEFEDPLGEKTFLFSDRTLIQEDNQRFKIVLLDFISREIMKQKSEIFPYFCTVKSEESDGGKVDAVLPGFIRLSLGD